MPIKKEELQKFKITLTPSPSESEEEDNDKTDDYDEKNTLQNKPMSVDTHEEKIKKGRPKKEMTDRQREVLKKARELKIKKYDDYKEHDYKTWLMTRGYIFEDKNAKKSQPPPPVIELKKEKPPTLEEKKERVMPKIVETPSNVKSDDVKKVEHAVKIVSKPKPRNPFAE